MRPDKRILISIAFLALMSGCRNQETALTGAYGQSLVAGRVVMSGGSNPAGVEVTLRGTGMRMTTGSDGSFAFRGAPANSELEFQRTDGIGRSIRVDGSVTNLVVELSASGSSRRRGAGRAMQYEGLIREVSATTIKVYTSHKDEVVFAVDAATRIRKGSKTYLLSDLKPEWRVHVTAETRNGILTALEIKVQNTNGEGDDDGDDDGSTITANGEVTAKSGSDLTVNSPSKGLVTVRTDANTIIKKQGVRITVAEIEVGDEINSQGERGADGVLLARQIEVRGKSKKSK